MRIEEEMNKGEEREQVGWKSWGGEDGVVLIYYSLKTGKQSKH